MQFIAQHTSIPMPKVYCTFKHKKWTYIVMERIEGEILCHGWSMRTIELKARILSQLKEMVTGIWNTRGFGTRDQPKPTPTIFLNNTL